MDASVCECAERKDRKLSPSFRPFSHWLLTRGAGKSLQEGVKSVVLLRTMTHVKGKKKKKHQKQDERMKAKKALRRTTNRQIKQLVENGYHVEAAERSGKAIATQVDDYVLQCHGKMRVQDAANDKLTILRSIMHPGIKEPLRREVVGFVDSDRSVSIPSANFGEAHQVNYIYDKNLEPCKVSSCGFTGEIMAGVLKPFLQEHFPELKYCFWGVLQNEVGIKKEDWERGDVHLDFPSTKHHLCTGGMLDELKKLPTSKWPVVLEISLDQPFDICVNYRYLRGNGTWAPGPEPDVEARHEETFEKKNRHKVPPFSFMLLPFHQEHQTAPPTEPETLVPRTRLHIYLGPTKEYAKVL